MDKQRDGAPGSFKYCFDPVCLTALTIYLANRWFMKPHWGAYISFFPDYLNDFLCIPLFLPPVLLVNCLLGVRQRSRYPTAFELLFHLVVWSVCFEVVAPLFSAVFHTTADPLDVAAYALGAGVAGLVWGSWRHGRLAGVWHGRSPARFRRGEDVRTPIVFP